MPPTPVYTLFRPYCILLLRVTKAPSKRPCRLPAGRCWPGQASTDTLGEIRRIARCLGTGVDVTALLEFRKGQAGIEPAYLIRVGRGVPAQENFPVIPRDASRRPGMEQDVGSTVGGQRIVEGRLLYQVIDLPHIVQEQATGLGRRDARAIQIDLLVRLPIRRAQANDVAFVRDHIDQLILLEKSFDRRVVLSTLFAGLNGNGNIVLLAKAKAH